MKRIITSTFLLLFLFTFATGQKAFTQYDQLPSLYESYKPVYDANYPNWAKLLYEYPVNFHEISQSFEHYMTEHPGKKSPVVRYFKLWKRAVSPYVSNDGTIILPEMEKLQHDLYQSQLNSGKGQNTTNLKNTESWSFLGPKQTFWLNESGAPGAPNSAPWQVNVYSFDVAPSDNDIL